MRLVLDVVVVVVVVRVSKTTRRKSQEAFLEGFVVGGAPKDEGSHLAQVDLALPPSPSPLALPPGFWQHLVL